MPISFPFFKSRRLELAEVRARAAEAALEEVTRAIASSPMLGTPIPGEKPPAGLPLYQFDRPIRYSTPQAPQRRPDSLVTLDTMRQLADTYDVLRSAVQHLKRELSAVPCEVVPRDQEADPKKFSKAIAEADAFFAPHGGLGGRGRRRSQFEAMWVEDVLVVGAACYYYRTTRGGKVYEVLPIDAATIRPRVDAYGWPGPGEARYEQWVYGVQVAAFEESEMTYDGLWPVTHTPYFKGAVEWILSPAMTAMKADEWNRSWLTDGNTPSDLLAAPESWTPEQIQTFYEWFDSLHSGNIQQRQKTKFVPSGTSRLMTPSRKDQDFQEFEMWLLRRVCSVLGVHPAAIGYAGDQYAVTQENSMDATSAFGVGQLLEFRKARYDDILERLGFPELETKNITGQEEAAAERAERLTKLVAGGIFSPNEARAEEGKDPVDGGDVLLVSSQFVPLDQWRSQSENETAMQKKQLSAPEASPEGGEPGGETEGAKGADKEKPSSSNDPLADLLSGRVVRAIGGSWITDEEGEHIFIKAKGFGFQLHQQHKPSGGSKPSGGHGASTDDRLKEKQAEVETRLRAAAEAAKAAGVSGGTLREIEEKALAEAQKQYHSQREGGTKHPEAVLAAWEHAVTAIEAATAEHTGKIEADPGFREAFQKVAGDARREGLSDEEIVAFGKAAVARIQKQIDERASHETAAQVRKHELTHAYSYLRVAFMRAFEAHYEAQTAREQAAMAAARKAGVREQDIDQAVRTTSGATRRERVDDFIKKLDLLGQMAGLRGERIEREAKESLETGKVFGAGNPDFKMHGIPAPLLKAYPEVARALYGQLHITPGEGEAEEGYSDPGGFARQSMGGLQNLPQPLLRAAAGTGAQFFVGNVPLKELDSAEALAAEPVKGYTHGHGGTYADSTAGVYEWRGSTGESQVEVCALARTYKNAGNVLLHEMGHLMGHHFFLNDAPALKQHFKRLHAKLSPYEQQGGPEDEVGKREFLAESFMTWYGFGKKAMIGRYDEKWAKAFEKLMAPHEKPPAAAGKEKS